MDLPTSDNWTFGEWIDAQTMLQVAGGKGDPINLSDDDRPNFFRWNGFAANAEIHEAVDEVKWKPWAAGPYYENRERVIGELVDGLHFIGNMLRAVGATGEEVTAAYKEKAQRNLDRWQEGYTGLDKCSVCRRDNAEMNGIRCADPNCPLPTTTPVGCWFGDCSEESVAFINRWETTPGGTRQSVRIKVCARHERLYYQEVNSPSEHDNIG